MIWIQNTANPAEAVEKNMFSNNSPLKDVMRDSHFSRNKLG